MMSDVLFYVLLGMVLYSFVMTFVTVRFISKHRAVNRDLEMGNRNMTERINRIGMQFGDLANDTDIVAKRPRKETRAEYKRIPNHPPGTPSYYVDDVFTGKMIYDNVRVPINLVMWEFMRHLGVDILYHEQTKQTKVIFRKREESKDGKGKKGSHGKKPRD